MLLSSSAHSHCLLAGVSTLKTPKSTTTCGVLAPAPIGTPQYQHELTLLGAEMSKPSLARPHPLLMMPQEMMLVEESASVH